MNRRLRLKKLPVVTVLTLAVATVISAATFAAEPSSAATTCSNGYVALTFDDGPNSNTNTLLNVLKANGVRATFFNIGTNAKNNPSLVTAEKAAGMWIGNHSWSHPHLTQLSSAQMATEISQTQQAIQQVTGSAPQLFRPPYGETNASLKSVEAQYGLTEVLWSVDSQDWNGASTSQIVQAAGTLQPGGVILMHDGYATTNAAVPQIVTNLASRGLCAGMISTSTGRAVAPDGTTPPSGGTCTAAYTPGTRWSDRFNGQVAISGTTSSAR